MTQLSPLPAPDLTVTVFAVVLVGLVLPFTALAGSGGQQTLWF